MISTSVPRPERSSRHQRSDSPRLLLDALGVDPGERLLSREQLAHLTSAVVQWGDVWRPRVRHETHRRWFELLHLTDAVEIWLIGWTPGQSTPVHDHGGALGALTVAEGQLTEVEYPDGEAGDRRRRLHDAPASAAFEAHHLHRVGNRGQVNATSIHAYSPSNLSMRTYDEIAAPYWPEVTADWQAAL